MINTRSIFEVLAALGTGATLLAACGEAPPPPAAVPVAAHEVPAAVPAVPGAPAAPAAAALPAAPAAPAAAPPAVPAAPPVAKPKAAKIPNSKRTADKAASGCCGAGTCSPC